VQRKGAVGECVDRRQQRSGQHEPAEHEAQQVNVAYAAPPTRPPPQAAHADGIEHAARTEQQRERDRPA
jgi:hypothetical protein